MTDAQCKTLLADYRKRKSKIMTLQNNFKKYLNGMMNGLDGVNNNLLDSVEDALSHLTIPELDFDSLFGSAAGCPVANSTMGIKKGSSLTTSSGQGKIPHSTINRYKEGLNKAMETRTAEALDVGTGNAMRGFKAYSDEIQRSGFGNNLSALNEIETCLESVCGVLASTDKIGSTISNALSLNSDGSVNTGIVAAAKGLDGASLSKAVGTYKSKFLTF